MDIFKLFTKNTCSLQGKDSLTWSWKEYYKQVKNASTTKTEIILVDMINHPVPGSVPISNELFEQKYVDGTYFVLYCHSGGSSGYLQKQLAKKFPRYNFVNMAGGIGMYKPE